MTAIFRCHYIDTSVNTRLYTVPGSSNCTDVSLTIRNFFKVMVYHLMGLNNPAIQLSFILQQMTSVHRQAEGHGFEVISTLQKYILISFFITQKQID